MSHGLQFTTDQIIEALEKTRGAVYLAADNLGCNAKTIQRRAQKVQAVQEVIEKYRERRTDLAEMKLESAIINGEQWAIVFQLQTQGRNRGYVKRVEEERILNPEESRLASISDEERIARIASIFDQAAARRDKNTNG